MATLVEIYEWFMTGKKPTQAQFWASWGSFWNKSEQIPQSSISGLPGVLNAKAEKAQFDAHKTDTAAHAALFAAKADAQALLNHIQATFDSIGLEAQNRANGDSSLQFQIDDTNDFLSQARSDIAAINTLLTSNDINLDTVQEIVDAIKTVETSLSTILVDDLTTGGVTKALTAEMGKTLKGLIDGLVIAKQAVLVSGTNIKTVNGVTLLGSGNVNTPDMDTTTAQSVSGLKTFLNNMFGLRNTANTFTSFFTNANTASRTYSLQDRNGILADLTDIASVNTNKMNVPTGGIANYLPKFLTPTTQGLSRLWDTGTYLGIGTSRAPTKDITFGNQANREIGIEESDNTIVGRDLIIKAGRTINYVSDSNFNPLIQIARPWYGMAASPNGNIYACVEGGDIYMQTAGVGNFVSLGQTSRNWLAMAASPNGNIYACARYGDIYMQTGGIGNFVSLGQTSRNWSGMAASPNGNIYACVEGGDIYMQTGGTGNFIGLGQTSRTWISMTAAPNGDIYAATWSGDIYKQTGGTGNFSPLGQVGAQWYGMAASPNGNIYASVSGKTIYMQTAGVGNFVSLGQTSRPWYGMAASPNGNIYACARNGDIYIQQNNGAGSPDLDGGGLKLIAGTGKGTGKSRFEIYTGQKTASGTDMQIETLREYIDENGYHVYTSMPVFADNLEAITGGLPVGCQYRTPTGDLKIVY